MAEDLHIKEGSKEEKYLSIIPQIKGLLKGESDIIANLANITASLKEQFEWLWVGFYILKNDELVLGPFQGPVACTRIRKGRGVCGASWEQNCSIIVPDVQKFPGHIACSSLSKSEIVIPIFSAGIFLGVLDVDSELLNDFDEVDERFLKEILEIFEENMQTEIHK
jgi:GAF domain-containing protein